MALESVVRTGSVTAAGAELSVTHGAISKQLGVLEEWAGMPLFEGDRRRLRPTLAAQTLARAADEAWNLIAAAAEEIAARDIYVILHVTAPTTFAMRWLIPRLPRFHALHPGVKVSMRQTEEIERWIDMPFDIAIRRGGQVPVQFQSTPLLTESACLVAAPKLVGSGRKVDLRDLPLLRAESRSGQLQSWLTMAGLPKSLANGARSLPHLYIALEAALSGEGALVAPVNLLPDLLSSRALVVVRPEVALRGPEYRLVYGQRTARSAAGIAFLDWVLRESRES